MQRQLRACLRGAVAIGAFTLFAEGCSTSTTITDVWRDPSYMAGPMRNLVVFGGRMDATRRRALEDGFVSALAAHGVHAVASYTLFPELPSKAVARAAMQQNGSHGDGRLVWSAITETENPSSGKDFTGSLLNKVMPALTQAGLITAEQARSVSYAPIPTAP